MSDFITLCLNGEVLPDEIDDFVDEWHDSDSEVAIYTFLGMDQQEYAAWVDDPDRLSYILLARRNNRSFLDVVHEQVNALAARAGDVGKSYELMEWLKREGLWEND